MGLGLAAILKAAASSLLGRTVQQAVTEKVTNVVREKLNLPPEAPEADIDAALTNDPETYAKLVEAATQYRIAAEETYRAALSEQGASERVALQSEHAFVRNARPAMLYMAGASIFVTIIFGFLILWVQPDKLGQYVDLVETLSGPMSLLMVAGGVYSWRRTTDKAIGAGVELPAPLKNWN